MLTTAKVETVQSFALNAGPDKSSTIGGQTELYCQMKPWISKSESGARRTSIKCATAHRTMVTQDCTVTYSYVSQGPFVHTRTTAWPLLPAFALVVCVAPSLSPGIGGRSTE
jgi:hypothetical protein